MTDPAALRLEFLSARASKAGYQLVPSRTAPDRWVLLDAEDSTPIRSDLALADIEQWLSE